jgi:hypothetical protein
MVEERINSSRRAFLAAGGAFIAQGRVEGWGGGEGAVTTGKEEREAPLVIDCHAHAGIAREPGTAGELSAPWETGADPATVLRHAREVGISKTVIFPINNTTYQEANQDIARLCERYPDRFIGFARHDARTESGQIRALLFHEVHDLGLRGLKLHTQPNTEMLDAARDLGIPVLYDSNEHVELFEEFLPSYPSVNFIIPHLGSDQSANWPGHLMAIELARRYPNVHLDTAAVVMTRYLEQAAKELPAEQILFGSDEPEIDCRLEIFKIRLLNLPQEKEELILGGNITRLLGGRV